MENWPRKITFCRCGKGVRKNLYAKGAFQKEFKSLTEFVRFKFMTRNKLFTPNIEAELTRKEIKLYMKKYYAYCTKHKEN